MSLKGVELQIAIPKTADAGKISEQHQQNVLQQQLNANEALKKATERKALTVNDTEPTEKITDDEHSSSGDSENQKEKSQQELDKEKPAIHPYKGHFFDYSG